MSQNIIFRIFRYVPKQLRKMSMFEVFIILSVILTIGHYLAMWARYFERKLALDEQIERRLKRRKKHDAEIDVELMTSRFAPKPKYYDILPVVLAKGSYNFCFWFPKYLRHVKEMKKRHKVGFRLRCVTAVYND